MARWLGFWPSIVDRDCLNLNFEPLLVCMNLRSDLKRRHIQYFVVANSCSTLHFVNHAFL